MSADRDGSDQASRLPAALEQLCHAGSLHDGVGRSLRVLEDARELVGRGECECAVVKDQAPVDNH